MPQTKYSRRCKATNLLKCNIDNVTPKPEFCIATSIATVFCCFKFKEIFLAIKKAIINPIKL